jgi:hypothetical protein
MINRWELEEDEDSDVDGMENFNSSPARRNKKATRMSSKNERSKDTSVSSSSIKNNNKNRYSASSTIDFFSDNDDLEEEELPQGERTSRNPYQSDTLQERSISKPNDNFSKNRSFQPVSSIPLPKPSRNGYNSPYREEDQNRHDNLALDSDDDEKKEEGKEILRSKADNFNPSNNARKKLGNEWASQSRAPKVLEVTKSMEQESWHDEEMSMNKESWHHEGNDRNKLGNVVDTKMTYIDDGQKEINRRPDRSNNMQKSPDSVKKTSLTQKPNVSETWSGKINNNKEKDEGSSERLSRSMNSPNSPKDVSKNVPQSHRKSPDNERSRNSYMNERHLEDDDDYDANRRSDSHSPVSGTSSPINLIPSPIRVEISRKDRDISPLKYSPTAFSSKERNPTRQDKERKERVEEDISPLPTPLTTPRSPVKSSPSTSPSLNYDHRNSAKNSRNERSEYSDRAFIQQNHMKPLESSWETTTGVPQQPHSQEHNLSLSPVKGGQGKGGVVRPPRPLSMPLKHHDIGEKIKESSKFERGRSYDSTGGEKEILVKRSISWSTAVANNSKPPRPKSTSSVVSASLASSHQSLDSNNKEYDEEGNVLASHDFDGHVALPPLSEYAIQTGVILEGWLEKKSTITGFWQKVNKI